MYKYLDEGGVHFLLWITAYVFMIFKNSIVLGGKGENLFLARIVFFFAWKRSQIKSFLLMLYTFYFDSVFYLIVRILSQSKRREVKFSFKVFSTLPPEDAFWMHMNSIAVQCFSSSCTKWIFFFNMFKIVFHYWGK